MEILDTNAILDRLKEHIGAKTDRALSKRLGYKNQSTLGNWRERDSVRIDRILEKFPEVDLNWLIKGERQPKVVGVDEVLLKQIERLTAQNKEYWETIKTLMTKL